MNMNRRITCLSKVVKRAFWEMELREQRLLEGRNAICMAFGRVSPMSKQKSFEELAVMFEGSGANGALWTSYA